MRKYLLFVLVIFCFITCGGKKRYVSQDSTGNILIGLLYSEDERKDLTVLFEREEKGKWQECKRMEMKDGKLIAITPLFLPVYFPGAETGQRVRIRVMRLGKEAEMVRYVLKKNQKDK